MGDNRGKKQEMVFGKKMERVSIQSSVKTNAQAGKKNHNCGMMHNKHPEKNTLVLSARPHTAPIQELLGNRAYCTMQRLLLLTRLSGKERNVFLSFRA
jgi:hypothetical protein